MWEIKEHKLKKVLLDAKKTSEYYANVLADIDIDNLTIEEFQKIKILEKNEYKKSYEKILPHNFSELDVEYESTSGSSGIPIMVPRTSSDRIRFGMVLTKFRSHIVGEYVSHEKCAKFAHRMSNTEQINSEGGLDLILDDHFSEHHLITTCEKILDFKPLMISGAGQTLAILSQYILDNNINMHQSNVKLIENRGEYLFPYQREITEKAFNCPTLSLYGCHEFWGIAYECKKHHFHVLDNVYLEVVDEKDNNVGNGVMGNVVITNVFCQTVPFIRYKLGDKVILHDDECECGLKTKYIDLVGIRFTDMVVTKEGKVDCTILYPVVSSFSKPEYQFIDQFQIVQNNIDKFSLYIKTSKNITEDMKLKFNELFTKALKHSIDLSIFINQPFFLNKNSKKMSYFYNELL